MENSNREQFAQMLAALAEYYGKPISPSTIEVYWSGLERFDLSDVRRAFNLHVANADTGQFMPKIADVVKFIEGNKDTAAIEAWNKVAKAIRDVGTYQSVEFNDKIIHAVISDMGGWPQIGLITEDELPFKIKEFERRYQAYLLRGLDHYPRQLVGIFAKENAKIGYTPADLVKIGFNAPERKAIAHPKKQA